MLFITLLLLCFADAHLSAADSGLSDGAGVPKSFAAAPPPSPIAIKAPAETDLEESAVKHPDCPTWNAMLRFETLSNMAEVVTPVPEERLEEELTDDLAETDVFEEFILTLMLLARSYYIRVLREQRAKLDLSKAEHKEIHTITQERSDAFNQLIDRYADEYDFPLWIVVMLKNGGRMKPGESAVPDECCPEWIEAEAAKRLISGALFSSDDGVLRVHWEQEARKDEC